MSFRDQKIHRVDHQSMVYSVNNASVKNSKPHFNNMKVTLEAAQKKSGEKSQDERAKSNVAFDFKTAFNQANLLTEQAAQVGNTHKTNFLADLLENKDQDNLLNALNLTFESGQSSSNTPRNLGSQDRF